MSLSLPRLSIAGLPFGFEDDDLEAWTEYLDELALDSELGELLNESFDLIDEGMTSFPPGRSHVIESVFRHHYDIARRVVDRGYPVARAIRLCVDEEGELRDSELICAYAIAKATKGLMRLADWVHALEQDLLDEDAPELIEGWRARLLAAKADEPEIYYQIVDDHRRQWPLREIEARESCVRFLGEARHTLLLSSVYEDLDNKRQFVESIRIEAKERRLRSAEGGRKGVAQQAWARRFLEANLERLAYDDDGRKRSKNNLVDLLLEQILPQERERQLERPNPHGKPSTPSRKTLYGNGSDNPGWLVSLGFNELPNTRIP